MKLRLNIRVKLIGLITLVLALAAGIIVTLATELFSRDNIARIQEANLESARLIASEVQSSAIYLTEKVRLLALNITREKDPKKLLEIQSALLETDQDLIAVSVVSHDRNGRVVRVGTSENSKILNTNQLSSTDILSAFQQISSNRLFKIDPSIDSFSLTKTLPALSIVIPLLSNEKGEVSHSALALFKQDRFLNAVAGQSIIESFVVDSQGNALAHPNHQFVSQNKNFSHLEIVRQMSSGKTNNGQTRYQDPETHATYLGAFRSVGFAGLGVIAQVEESKALEAARRVRDLSLIITGMVAVIGFLIVFFFSLSLTQPLLRLVDASDQISQGQYEVQLKRKSNDEIGDLTDAFKQMAIGLAEREKIKQAFAKFHSKEISEKLLSGELKLGGERKTATVFFSDVRGFTAMSERMDPEALVSILNRYMTKMVSVIIQYGGIVDKYVGDAIMAIWGVPLSKSDDATRSIMACLEMRRALAEFNAELIAENLPTLKIGMGLNFGPLVSGNIGSEERMEYTVIGDTVNTASRVESLTKEFGTDLLVSKAVLDQTDGRFIVTRTHEAKVKGKSEPLVIFTVQGYRDENGQEIIIQTPYSSYEASRSDKVVHDAPVAPATPSSPPPMHSPAVVPPPAPPSATSNTVTTPSILEKTLTLSRIDLTRYTDDAGISDEISVPSVPLPPTAPVPKAPPSAEVVAELEGTVLLDADEDSAA